MQARSLNAWILIAIAAIVFELYVSAPQFSYAQTQPSQVVLTPSVSAKEIKTKIISIAENSALSSDEQKEIQDIYKSALGRLENGNTDKSNADRINNLRKNAQKDIVAENALLKIVSKELNDPNRDLFRQYEKQNLELSALEKTLAEQSENLANLRDLLSQKQAAKISVDQFSTEVTSLRASNTEKITELTQKMAQQEKTNTKPADKARYVLAQASLYARFQNNRMLDERDRYTPQESELLGVQISHIVAQISQKAGVVNTLRIMTGSVRSTVAEQMSSESIQELEKVGSRHALLQAYAQENVNMSMRLSNLVQTREDLPAIETQIIRQTAQVTFDQNIADQIIGTKKTSRSYGLHLRQLRQKQPNIARIRAIIKTRDVELQDVLFQKIINQEALDLFNASPMNVEFELTKFISQQKQSGDASSIETVQAVNQADAAHLRDLHESRREILNALASYSELKRRNLEDINLLQTTLLDDVTALCILLDGRLLWLPSTEPLGFLWPGKVVSGITSTLSGANVGNVVQGFWSGLRKNYYFVFLALLLWGLSFVLEDRYKPVLRSMNSRVGRVQKDSYLLTPTAVIDGIMKVIPWVLIPLVIGLIFGSSSVDTSLSIPFMQTGLILTGLTFVFLVLREWCKKGALFDLHFRVDMELRTRLIKHIPWLLAAQAISVLLIGLTRDNLDYDSGASALGVLGFLIGSISIAVFAVKIAWGRNKSFKKNVRDTDGIYLHNEKWFFLIAIIMPLITALLAVFGYYETARLLLSRFFLSFCVMMAAYVSHGLLRRTVVIAQRRLALEQARIRRDKAVKVRMDKVAAEERGELLVPSLDYDRIDLETINRQSIQLVNVTVFIVTIGSLWALWSSLLPALSVFNEVEAWGYDKLNTAGHVIMDKETNLPVHVTISYWNLMQAFGIGLITWLAARNLPGFLEVFVLKRMRMEQSSRFAIITVLGYLIFIAGVLIAFDKLGTQWSQLQWIVAALSVGIGLGLQAIFANFVSGLIILFERPVRIGDYITVGDISGTVTRIQIRATTLIDLDNKEILIPNQELVSQQVTNWTLSNAVTRLKFTIGIAYGSDTGLAHETMLSTIKLNPNVVASPEPTVLFLGFGDSTLDFEVRVFLRDFVQRFMVSHELHMALDQELRKAGIEIAFPQRDLHIKNPEALQFVSQSPPQKGRL